MGKLELPLLTACCAADLSWSAAPARDAAVESRNSICVAEQLTSLISA
jgi:hypothetical protein